MLGLIIVSFFVLCLLVTMVASSWSDFKTLRIPNAYVVVIGVSFLAAYAVAPDLFGKWWEHGASFLIFFILTYVMFHLGLMGAGDSKYGSVLALWVGLKGIVAYIFYMAVVGGVLGIIGLFVQKKKPFKNKPKSLWLQVLQEGKSDMPYGIALTAGALAGLFHTKFFYHILHELSKIIH